MRALPIFRKLGLTISICRIIIRIIVEVSANEEGGSPRRASRAVGARTKDRGGSATPLRSWNRPEIGFYPWSPVVQRGQHAGLTTPRTRSKPWQGNQGPNQWARRCANSGGPDHKPRELGPRPMTTNAYIADSVGFFQPRSGPIPQIRGYVHEHPSPR